MKSNVKGRMGHNIQQKEKKLVTKQYDKKKIGHNKPLLCCKFPSTETQCPSNEGFSYISYIMPNLFVLSLSLSVWWDKELVENFHNYSVFLKSCASLVSLFEINMSQCLSLFS